MESITLLIKEINTSPFIVVHVGLSVSQVLSMTESKSKEKLNGPIFSSVHKFLFPVKMIIKDVTVVILDFLINGFSKTTSLIKLVLLIKLLDTIMASDVQLK